MKHYLDFEMKLKPLEARLEEIRKFHDPNDPHFAKEIRSLERKIAKLEKEIYSDLSPWQKTQISRHLNRPRTLDYVSNLFNDYFEIHGDRKFKDDPALVGGFGKFNGRSVAFLGHQKGRDIKEMAYRNFGMAHPEGYRKAIRIMDLANRWKKPLITFIDTPGAYPGVGAEERGQAEAIASSIYFMFTLEIPIVSVVIGEGGSGGALAIGVADRILMLENSIYSVISPEGCAAILWRDGTKAHQAASSLKLTAQDLYELKVVDQIVKEPFGGAHRNWSETFMNTKEAIQAHLQELTNIPPEELKERRYEKFKRMGIFLE
ncbi:MAG: acetyl-CoA carboxylase carboxyltransferase subunit alpha [Desulfobacterota bacterium]|nr:acetyl-CoA carboxylase carboxyltransferase subunit alpha [Thermodesulfobacteriota bacterium]MDW8002084.1 acetyl-CoA carboxylase carboxyltransferase subunit alpha [Deltaproteobacteria bacterium]